MIELHFLCLLFLLLAAMALGARSMKAASVLGTLAFLAYWGGDTAAKAFASTLGS
jgi:hypothetical protein